MIFFHENRAYKEEFYKKIKNEKVNPLFHFSFDKKAYVIIPETYKIIFYELWKTLGF